MLVVIEGAAKLLESFNKVRALAFIEPVYNRSFGMRERTVMLDYSVANRKHVAGKDSSCYIPRANVPLNLVAGYVIFLEYLYASPPRALSELDKGGEDNHFV